MADSDVMDKVNEQGENVAEDGKQEGSVSVANEDGERPNSITAADDQQGSSVSVTDTDPKLEESIAEDGKERASFVATDNAQPASIVINNATSDCQTTCQTVPFTQRITDVPERIRQPTSDHESGIVLSGM